MFVCFAGVELDSPPEEISIVKKKWVKQKLSKCIFLIIKSTSYISGKSEPKKPSHSRILNELTMCYVKEVVGFGGYSSI